MYRYENPFVTASSRQIIGDINALSRHLRELNVPRPAAMFRMLFQPHQGQGQGSTSAPWFQAVNVWSEIEDIYDSESFGEFEFPSSSILIGRRGVRSNAMGKEFRRDRGSTVALP